MTAIDVAPLPTCESPNGLGISIAEHETFVDDAVIRAMIGADEVIAPAPQRKPLNMPNYGGEADYFAERRMAFAR